jgi:hypothetical protein
LRVSRDSIAGICTICATRKTYKTITGERLSAAIKQFTERLISAGSRSHGLLIPEAILFTPQCFSMTQPTAPTFPGALLAEDESGGMTL